MIFSPDYFAKMKPPIGIVRTGWGDALEAGGYQYQKKGRWHAIEIGPRSEASEVLIYPGNTTVQKLPYTPASSGAEPNYYAPTDLDPHKAIHLRSGEPYVGPIEGPILFMPARSDLFYSSGANGFHPVQTNETITTPALNPYGYRWGVAGPGGEPGHRLELLLWETPPHVFRRRRPDATYAQVIPTIGTTVAEQDVLWVPFMGRRRATVTVQSSQATVGTFTTRIYCYAACLHGAAPVVKVIEFVNTASTEQKFYEIEGDYDSIRVTVQTATSGASAGCRVHMLCKDAD